MRVNPEKLKVMSNAEALEMIEEELRPQVHIKCSACTKPLMSIMITDQNAIDSKTGKPFEWKVKATCPYCGDESFVHTVKGRLHPVGWALPNKDNPEDVFIKTFLDEQEFISDNEITFHVKIA